MKTKEFQYKLSIITVNLNNKYGLQKTIDSVIAQTYKDFEWIIIDGGSTDGSKELIEKYGDYISHWVSKSDNGIYNAMNKGIRVAHGEYLLFLNSGDIFYRNDILENVISRLKGKDLYVGDFIVENYSSKLDLSTSHKIIETLLKTGFPHQSIFYHHHVFHKEGFYREDLKTCSDWILNIKAVIFGNAIIEKLPFVISVYEPGGISSQKEAVAKDLKKLTDENKNLSDIFAFYVKYSSLIEKIRNDSILHHLGLWYARNIKRWV